MFKPVVVPKYNDFFFWLNFNYLASFFFSTIRLACSTKLRTYSYYF